MSHKFLIVFTLLFLLNSWTSCFAGGVSSYTGNLSTSNVSINRSSGSASANLNLEFKVSKILALGIYDSTGNINNPIFNSPIDNFPSGSIFPVTGNTLIQSESDLVSKFDIDATSSSDDAALIINAINSNSEIRSQDVLIKGAIFTNLAPSANLRLRTSSNQIVFSGGTGTAPRMRLRLVAGIPNVSTATSTNPQSGVILNGARRNANGYARFAIVGDLRENQLNSSTNGNWIANMTISLIRL